MTISILALATKMKKVSNPTTLALTILAISIPVSMIMQKTTKTSWMSFILILTFSSGMMILFIYATSLTPNEKESPRKKNKMIPILLTAMVTMPMMNQSTMKTSMKTFSSQMVIAMATAILILTMLTISTHGYNPNQSVSSSF